MPLRSLLSVLMSVALVSCGGAAVSAERDERAEIRLRPGGCEAQPAEPLGTLEARRLGALADVRYALGRVVEGGSAIEERDEVSRTYLYAIVEVSEWHAAPEPAPTRVAVVYLVGEEGAEGHGDATPDPRFDAMCAHAGEPISFAFVPGEAPALAEALDVPVMQVLAVGDVASFDALREGRWPDQTTSSGSDAR